MNLTISQANRIYDILVREAGASNREFHRINFTTALVSFTEHRFCGALGFGGKFVIAHDAWYVTASTEDMTDSVVGRIVAANRELANLKAWYAARTAAVEATA